MGAGPVEAKPSQGFSPTPPFPTSPVPRRWSPESSAGGTDGLERVLGPASPWCTELPPPLDPAFTLIWSQYDPRGRRCVYVSDSIKSLERASKLVIGGGSLLSMVWTNPRNFESIPVLPAGLAPRGRQDIGTLLHTQSKASRLPWLGRACHLSVCTVPPTPPDCGSAESLSRAT